MFNFNLPGGLVKLVLELLRFTSEQFLFFLLQDPGQKWVYYTNVGILSHLHRYTAYCTPKKASWSLSVIGERYILTTVLRCPRYTRSRLLNLAFTYFCHEAYVPTNGSAGPFSGD